MKLSVIIITHNNYVLKDGCIEAEILSILNQTETNFEIIVVDNCSNKTSFNNLQNFISKLNNSNIKLVKNNVNNISKARNLGANTAISNLLLFMDDDILLPQKNTFTKLLSHAQNNVYGFSAVRYWTNEGWFGNNKAELMNALKNNNENFNIQMDFPNPEIRQKKNDRHLIRTYIGNFGFIKKNALNAVGNWREDFIGYGVEDDCLAFALFMKYNRPAILKDIHVVHIWHKIANKNYQQLKINSQKYMEILNSFGVKYFHVGRVLYEEPNVLDYINN